MTMFKRLTILFFIFTTSLLANVLHAKAYKGAELYSNQSYVYGRYEMRMRTASMSGVVSTFFTYKNGSEVSNTFWEEIDIEVFGKNNASQWQSNVILGTQRPTINTEQVHNAATPLGSSYHTYVLEWTPDYLAWFVDGTEARRITGTSTVTSLTNAETIRFNIWSSTDTNWVGAFDSSQLPVYQFIQYIDYKSYNATTKKFEDSWRDDFNSFDSSRWGKGNWTFDGNRVDFSPDNIVIKDGVLVLALTAEGATGFTGTVPADEISSASSSVANSSVESSSTSSSAESSVSSSVTVSSVAASSVASSLTTSGGHKSGGGGSANWMTLMLIISLLFVRHR